MIYNGNSCDYLHQFGIDPNRIPLDGWDQTGYRSFPGDGPVGDGTKTPIRHDWPDGFEYARFLAAYYADEPSRRPGVHAEPWKPKGEV